MYRGYCTLQHWYIISVWRGTVHLIVITWWYRAMWRSFFTFWQKIGQYISFSEIFGHFWNFSIFQKIILAYFYSFSQNSPFSLIFNFFWNLIFFNLFIFYHFEHFWAHFAFLGNFLSFFLKKFWNFLKFQFFLNFIFLSFWTFLGSFCVNICPFWLET